MLTLGAFFERHLIAPGTLWELKAKANGYAFALGSELVTQAAEGRNFELIEVSSSECPREGISSRIKVRLLEDGYICWLDLEKVIGKAIHRGRWSPEMLDLFEIRGRIPQILDWVEKALKKPNKYLWGGTLGPDFDCSGLVQAAFASQSIWLPRDAYQLERFCEKVEVSCLDLSYLIPGDLIFFGTMQKCNHVAIYKGEGMYFHSSGVSHGRNGIGIDGLFSEDKHPVASYYRAQFRGAGRVNRCHDGTTLP